MKGSHVPHYPALILCLWALRSSAHTTRAIVCRPQVWEGKGVISYGRTMIGATNPLASAPGTIRGDYGIDVGRNIIHGSDSVDVSVTLT